MNARKLVGQDWLSQEIASAINSWKERRLLGACEDACVVYYAKQLRSRAIGAGALRIKRCHLHMALYIAPKRGMFPSYEEVEDSIRSYVDEKGNA